MKINKNLAEEALRAFCDVESNTDQFDNRIDPVTAEDDEASKLTVGDVIEEILGLTLEMHEATQ